MKIKSKLYKHLTSQYAKLINKGFLDQYELELNTEFNIFAYSYVSERKDGEPLTKEQMTFLAGLDKGFNLILEEISNG